MAPPGEVVLGLKKGRVRHIVRGEGELVDHIHIHPCLHLRQYYPHLCQHHRHPCPHLHQDHPHLHQDQRLLLHHLASKAGER